MSLIFAIVLIPMMMLVGLALDFGFYNEAQAQLDMAADSAAMHAARVAALFVQQQGMASAQGQNDTTCATVGAEAATSWFTAQLGKMAQLTSTITPNVTINCGTQSTQVTATVTYGGYVGTHFYRLFNATPNWGITGQTVAVISIPSFTEVDVLADNSSSMMIAATANDIQKMEALTPCSVQAQAESLQDINQNYGWAYTPIGGAYNSDFPRSAISNAVAQNFYAGANYGNSPLFVNGKLYLPYGYGTLIYPGPGSTPTNIVSATQYFAQPPAGTSTGQCDQRFDPNPSSLIAAECPYTPSLLNAPLAPTGVAINSAGQCTLNGQLHGGGKELSLAVGGATAPANWIARNNTPTAPCAFACHNKAGQDYYALATNNNVVLRYSVVQQAIATTIQAMQTSPAASQLSVGVYQFNAPGGVTCQTNGIWQVYPPANPNNLNGCNASGTWYTTPEAGTNFSSAMSDAQQIQPPITNDQPDTDFEYAMSALGGQLKPAGSGSLPTAPRKNLFIITDGMDDYSTAYDPNNPNNVYATDNRVTHAFNPAACANFKNAVSSGGLGYTVYVLYIDYYPLPNPWYFTHGAMSAAEGSNGGTSPIVQQLEQCASSSASPYFIEVQNGNLANITSALNTMLKSAIGSAGRYAQ